MTEDRAKSECEPRLRVKRAVSQIDVLRTAANG